MCSFERHKVGAKKIGAREKCDELHRNTFTLNRAGSAPACVSSLLFLFCYALLTRAVLLRTRLRYSS